MTRQPTQTTKVWCCSKCRAIYRTDFPRCPNDGAEVVVVDRDPLLGTKIDRYLVERLIGEGGMGRVYAAHDEAAPHLKFAIKVLLGDHAATASMRKRFLKEAHHASALAHPNVVRVFAHGEMSSGLPFLVMEIVDGPSLYQILQAGPVDPLRVIMLARGVCEGLAHAHAAGVLHRDLKPDNILVVNGRDGEVPRIVDFGLARATGHEDERLTATGVVMGTPAYIAPEQVAGKEVDHRADLYGLGATLFEALTGGLLPFEGSSIEITTAKAHGEPPTIGVRAPNLEVPATLQALVARLLARVPDQRYPTARAVIVDLDRIAGELTRLHWWGLRRKPTHMPSSTRSRWPIVLVGVGAAIGVAAFGVVMLRGNGDTDPAPVPPAPIAAIAPVAPVTEKVAIAPSVDAKPPSPVTPKAARSGSRDPSPTPSRSDRRTSNKGAREATPRAGSSSPAVAPKGPADAVKMPPVVPPPTLPPRAPLRAELSNLVVRGALTTSDVQRAVFRLKPSLARCVPSQATSVTVEFTVDDSRRAKDVRASGGSPATNTCVATVLGAARTHSAPDVGDAKVSVEVRFVESP